VACSGEHGAEPLGSAATELVGLCMNDFILVEIWMDIREGCL
jgi:hypothetical protein